MKSLNSRILYIFISLIFILACTLAGTTSNPGTGAPQNPPVGGNTQSGQPPAQSVSLAGPQIGTTMAWVDDSLLVYVPAGDFTMGPTDPQYVSSDAPAHIINLSGFWIYRHKVTNAQYALCVAAGQCTSTHIEETVQLTGFTELRDYPAKRDFPVISVDWTQADAYCRWIGGHIPTEAQWEKTARGPNGNTYPWGEQEPHCGLLNFNNCFSGPTSVRSFPDGRSYYQAFDMVGSTYEWAQDWYDKNYYAVSPPVDPPGPAGGENRVMRGSGFRTGGLYSNPFYRNQSLPTAFLDDLGFRCVVEGANAHIPTPYCEVPAFLPGYAPGIIPPADSPPASCQPPSVEIGGSYCSSHSPYTNLIVNGTVSSENSSLNCSDQGNGFWACTGSDNASDSVTFCGSCGNNAPPVAAIPIPACPAGYQSVPGTNTCIADPDSPENLGEICQTGFTPIARVDGGSLVCVAPVSSLIAAVPNTPAAPNTPITSLAVCPAGTYFDGLANGCVGAPAPAPSCLQGHTLDANLGCCAVPPGSQPVGACAAGEFYNPSLHTCLPLPVNTAASGDSCMKVDITLGACTPGQRERSESCAPVLCKDKAQEWDSGSCSCVTVLP